MNSPCTGMPSPGLAPGVGTSAQLGSRAVRGHVQGVLPSLRVVAMPKSVTDALPCRQSWCWMLTSSSVQSSAPSWPAGQGGRPWPAAYGQAAQWCSLPLRLPLMQRGPGSWTIRRRLAEQWPLRRKQVRRP